MTLPLSPVARKTTPTEWPFRWWQKDNGGDLLWHDERRSTRSHIIWVSIPAPLIRGCTRVRKSQDRLSSKTKLGLACYGLDCTIMAGFLSHSRFLFCRWHTRVRVSLHFLVCTNPCCCSTFVKNQQAAVSSHLTVASLPAPPPELRHRPAMGANTINNNNALDNNLGALSLSDRKALVENVLKTNVMTLDWANTLIMADANRSNGNGKEDQEREDGSARIAVQSELRSVSSGEERQRERAATTTSDNNDSCHPQCAICLERLLVDESIGVSHDAECPHLFHKTCIAEWLLTNQDCPVYRRDFLAVTTTTTTAHRTTPT
jgi:hypothetical protein